MHEADEHDIFYEGGAANDRELDERTLTTIGVDVGSSTFHFMFSALHLQRAGGRQGRFAVTKREVLWRSPVDLTPYRGGHIDAAAISTAIGLGHQAARIPLDELDSGALILTGDALRAKNADALGDEIAMLTGNILRVTAGDHLEAMLAAFGSGAIGIARNRDQCLLHVDIGGGTTKFAVIDPSGVRQTAAINGGGRIVAFDDSRRVVRLGAGARVIAQAAGVEVAVGTRLSEQQGIELAEVLAEAIAGIINHATKGTAASRLRLTPILDGSWQPEAISFSGGVSEYLYAREHRNFGDIGAEIANALRSRLDDGTIALPLIEPGEGIRATVIGAAQSTTELSANAIDEQANAVLPLKGVLVVHPHLDDTNASTISGSIAKTTRLYGIKASDPVALSISWHGQVAAEQMVQLADGIRNWVRGTVRTAPLIVLLEQRLAAQLETALNREGSAGAPIVCLDGIHLSSLDYLDVGKRIEPAGVVPLVIKSLLFEVDEDQHQVRSGES